MAKKINLSKKIKKILIKNKSNDTDENSEYDQNFSSDATDINKKDSGNSNIFDFWKEISEEIKMIEWPTIERLFKQFVIVVISLVGSALLIYSVDGLFAWGSKNLFEGKL